MLQFGTLGHLKNRNFDRLNDRKPSIENTRLKQKCRFIFKTNGTLKWSNLIDQKKCYQNEHGSL